MAYPQLQWPAVSPSNTFVFTLPPVQKPVPSGSDEMEAIRSDSITFSGLKQSMWYRTDLYKHLIMDWVLIFTDMATWQSFIAYALEGNSFLYWPDSGGTAYDEFWMEDCGGSARDQLATDNWAPKFNARGVAQFEVVMRKVPRGLTHA